MDMSKLPKLSGDQPPRPTPIPDAAPRDGAPVPADNPPYAERSDYRTAPTAGGAEAWISIGIAAILLFLTPGLLIFLSGGNPGTVTDFDGQPMRYVDSIFFQRDLAVTLFAIALILEGLILAFIRNAPAVMAVMIFTAIATVVNLVYVLSTFRAYGIHLVCAFAVVFGVYMVINEWKLYQQLRRGRA
jgi:hypothetical protein